MYNRYIREGGGNSECLFSPITDEPVGSREAGEIRHEKKRAPDLTDGLFGGLFGRGGKGPALKGFFHDLEAGDLILIAIILLMFLEGENNEIIIVLGLVLLLGL